jgi:hypothetical protein
MTKKNETAPANQSDATLRFNLDIQIDDGLFGRAIRDRAEQEPATPETAPDMLILSYPDSFSIDQESTTGQLVAYEGQRRIRVITRFSAVENGIGFMLGSESFSIPFPGSAKDLAELHRLLKVREAAQESSQRATDQPDDKPQSKAIVKEPLSHPCDLSETPRVPNDPASILFNKFIVQNNTPDVWRTNRDEGYIYAQDGNKIVTYQPEEEIPDSWLDFQDRVLESLEKRFTTMRGGLVADVADILFWHWFTNHRPPFASITLSQVLEYRGVKARPNVIQEHWQAMRDVRAIKLRGEGIEQENLFHISAAQGTLWGTTEPPKLRTLYRYHPGYFLAEAIQNEAFFLAYHARKVWQLDYYRDANAKKIARALRADWRLNAENYLPTTLKPRYRTWGTLLADAGIDVTSGVAISNPTRFIHSIESEVEKLYKIEFTRDAGLYIYDPKDRPKREALPRFSLLTAWLALRIHIAPAADITDALKHTATRRLARTEAAKALPESAQTKRKGRSKRAEK